MWGEDLEFCEAPKLFGVASGDWLQNSWELAGALEVVLTFGFTA